MSGFIFDIDDTLYSRQALLTQAARESAGIRPQDEGRLMQIFMEKAVENTPQVERGEITALQSNAWRYAESFRILGIPEPEQKGQEAAECYAALQGRIALSDPLRDMFDRLTEKGAALGILTTGESRHQWRKYEMLELSRWIPKERVIISGERGVTKPDPRAFRILEEYTGVPPADLWMIGDSYESDICGAARCGWHTVWINRRNLPAGQILADRTVRDEDEMARAVCLL